MKSAVKSTLVFVGLVASVAMLSSCGSYRHGPEGHAKYAERMTERLAGELDLNDVQRARLDALRQTLVGVAQKVHDDRDTTRDSVLELLGQRTFDRSRALSLIEVKTQQVNDKAPAVVGAFGDFYDSLDAEQQAKLRERIEKRWERRGYCRK